MSTKSTPNATRASIICLACEFEKTARTIADELNVKVATVRKIVRQFRTSGQINAKRRGGANNATKLSAEMKIIIMLLFIKFQLCEVFLRQILPSTLYSFLHTHPNSMEDKSTTQCANN